jgi:hypothetical protein
MYRECDGFAHGLCGHEQVVLLHVLHHIPAPRAPPRVVVQPHKPAHAVAPPIRQNIKQSRFAGAARTQYRHHFLRT